MKNFLKRQWLGVILLIGFVGMITYNGLYVWPDNPQYKAGTKLYRTQPAQGDAAPITTYVIVDGYDQVDDDYYYRFIAITYFTDSTYVARTGSLIKDAFEASVKEYRPFTAEEDSVIFYNQR